MSARLSASDFTIATINNGCVFNTDHLLASFEAGNEGLNLLP